MRKKGQKYVNYEELEADTVEVIQFFKDELEIDTVSEGLTLIDSLKEFLVSQNEENQYESQIDTELDYIS